MGDGGGWSNHRSLSLIKWSLMSCHSMMVYVNLPEKDASEVIKSVAGHGKNISFAVVIQEQARVSLPPRPAGCFSLGSEVHRIPRVWWLKHGHEDRPCDVGPSVGGPAQRRGTLPIISQKAGDICKLGGGGSGTVRGFQRSCYKPP